MHIRRWVPKNRHGRVRACSCCARWVPDGRFRGSDLLSRLAGRVFFKVQNGPDFEWVRPTRSGRLVVTLPGERKGRCADGRGFPRPLAGVSMAQDVTWAWLPAAPHPFQPPHHRDPAQAGRIVQHPGGTVDSALQDATTSTPPIMLLPRTTPANAPARRSASASATRRSG